MVLVPPGQGGPALNCLRAAFPGRGISKLRGRAPECGPGEKQLR